MALIIGQISSPLILLSVFIFLWSNDTFAFLIGKSIGRNKLFESISPKKTIEGFVGGLLGTLITAIIIFYVKETETIWFWLALGAIVSVSGTFGDLFESLLKRKAGIKDSGNIMPGHGGILDRIDSLLFAIPFSYLFILLIKFITL